MIKAIYLDFDGTTYSHSQNRIPASATEALKKAQDNGIQIILATGRPMAELKTFDMSGLDFDAYVVNNGQAIFNKECKCIYISAIEGKLFERILEYFNQKEIPIIMNTAEDMYINITNGHVKRVQDSINTALPEIREYNNEKIIMASVFTKDEKTKDEIFQMEDIAELTWWNEGAFDIVPKGASKAKGIEEMNAILGISKEECLAIGDGENDIEMMKYCGSSIAMGNSLDSVKEIADYVTDHIDENGMKNALKHYKLI